MKRKNNRAVEEFKEPIAMKKGDPRVICNGLPIRADFRIISEANYQTLYTAFKRECARKAKINTKNSVLHIFSVVFSFLRVGNKKPKQTCKNCRFNCEDDHTCMNDCNVGSYYAEKGLNRICYEGELWEGK